LDLKKDKENKWHLIVIILNNSMIIIYDYNIFQ
jgi:hypothetical protein